MILNRKPKAIIPVGKTFGRLTVIERVIPSPRRPIVRCKCSCGKTHDVLLSSLTKGNTRSCGCLLAESSRARQTKHAMYKTDEYRAWQAMRARCLNPKGIAFQYYGGRGIKICQEWNDFMAFFSDMGQKTSPKHSLERINNDLGYCKSNCKWATREEQSYNKRSNRFITFGGTRLPISQWAKKLGIHLQTLRNRIDRGWTVERAMTERVAA